MLVWPPKSEFFELKSDYPGPLATLLIPAKGPLPSGFPKRDPVAGFEPAPKSPPGLLTAPPKSPPPAELLLLIEFPKSPPPEAFLSPPNKLYPDGLPKREVYLPTAPPPNKPELYFSVPAFVSCFVSSLSFLSALLLTGFAPNSPPKGAESLN